jgi:DNA (cytosine-5)-methyltransferase 1
MVMPRTPANTSKPLRALSLFAGAGGLDLGVERAGYGVVYAIENDPTAAATLNKNRSRFFPHLPEVVPLDVTTLDPQQVMTDIGLKAGDLDLLVGGPPCVAFSKSGFHLEYKREGRDPKANLLDDYRRFLKALRPKAFLMENVFGLAYRNQSRSFFDALCAGIKADGYHLSFAVLNAADYGVPQNRQRLFLIGAREGPELSLPQPTHWGAHERRLPPADVERLKPHVTAGEALAGLTTKPESGEAVNGKWGHLLPEIPAGRNYLHYTAERGHAQPLFEWRSRYWTFLLKLDPNRPSPTLQGQPGPYVGPFHWDDRRLRVPELKRLHGFPDDYVLEGSRRDAVLQVGNAVPPLLGQVVARAIREQLIPSTATSSIKAPATRTRRVGSVRGSGLALS